MKARKLWIASGLMLAAVTFTACEKDGSEDLYGIDKKEIKEQDTKVFDREIDIQGLQSIDKKEIKERDT